MFFDGASNAFGHDIGIVLISPKERCFPFTVRLSFNCTNNMAEYEASVMGIAMALEYQIKDPKVYGDSALNQPRVDYTIVSFSYLMPVKTTKRELINHTPREENQMADALATLASMFEVS
ncbi:hypothetical protein CR513_35420, partial [Mucuna pruriens]